MNIVNAEVAQSTRRDARLGEHVDAMARIIERRLDIDIDRGSAEFARFATHVRYLMNRSATGAVGPDASVALLCKMAGSDPSLLKCAHDLMDYLVDHAGLSRSDDEMLYLMLHVSRLVAATREG